METPLSTNENPSAASGTMAGLSADVFPEAGGDGQGYLFSKPLRCPSSRRGSQIEA